MIANNNKKIKQFTIMFNEKLEKNLDFNKM